ncbi:MAG: acryloyl-CoA reductase [Acidimicrobiales bacterium]
MTIPGHFRALVAERVSDDKVIREIRELTPDDLPTGDVTVRVEWSSVNYKDGMAVSPGGRVARVSPLVPGVDLAGEVVASGHDDIRTGDRVIVHGYELGVSHDGGFAEYARVPAGWVVPLPKPLTTRQAMAIGTAGYTAALSVRVLEERGLDDESGPVLVLGASGGVGSTAVAILAKHGYEVWASTGKLHEADLLRELGAHEVIGREETSAESAKPLETERWAAVVDPVGGSSLAYALRTLRYGAAVASSGLTGGATLPTTVYPFVLRAVALLGVDSVRTPMLERRAVWERLATDLRPPLLEERITREIGLDELDAFLDDVIAGRAVGRTVVRLAG